MAHSREMLSAALSLAELGWSVIPLCHPQHAGPHSQGHKDRCERAGKMPTVRWTERQVEPYSLTELNTIWTRNPHFNVGVVTGAVSGIVMVDIDTEVGESHWLLQWGGAQWQTWEFGTGRGGRHLVYRWPVDQPPRGNPFPGMVGHIDFLGEGRQSVVPPSAHVKSYGYQWKMGGPGSSMPLAYCPSALVDAVLGVQRGEDRQPVVCEGDWTQDVPKPNKARTDARVLNWVRHFEPSISGSGGHAVAFKLACSLIHGFGLSDTDAVSLMTHEWNGRCQPPWTFPDIVRKVREAREKGSFPKIEERPFGSSTPTPKSDPTPQPTQTRTATAPAVAVAKSPFRRASSLQQKAYRYFLDPWIPAGCLTLLAGRPGSGKSTFLAYLPSLARHTIYLVGEEDPEGLFRDRLEANGVNRDRLDVATPGRDFRLPDAMRALESQVTQTGADLIIADPLSAFFDTGLSADSNPDVERVLYPLADLAHRTGAAVVAIRHPGKAKDNVLRGAQAWMDIPRVVIELVVNWGPPEVRLIRHVKNNERGGMAPACYFTCEGEGKAPRRFVMGKFVHDVDAEMANDDTDRIEQLKVEEAVDFLRAILANGEVESQQVYKQAETERLSDRTIRTASLKVGVIKRREGVGKEHRSLWALPPVAVEEPKTEEAKP